MNAHPQLIFAKEQEALPQANRLRLIRFCKHHHHWSPESQPLSLYSLQLH